MQVWIVENKLMLLEDALNSENKICPCYITTYPVEARD